MPSILTEDESSIYHEDDSCPAAQEQEPFEPEPKGDGES
jgi:hypothetical protein